MDNFGQLWRELRLHCPFVPVPLAQRWVRDRYRKLLAKCLWSATVAESEFLIPAAYSTGTISVTNNSPTVTGSGTTFTSSMVGRQLIVNGEGPYYTISAFVDATTLTLERVYGGSTASGQSYSIVQAYLTPPSDFHSLKVVVDPANQWKLRVNIPQEFLNTADPARTQSGTPRLLADYRFSSSGIPRFEIWPRQTSQARYPFLYFKKPADLSADTDEPVFPIRGDVIKTGALADLAKWPGTEDRRNPMFDLRLAKAYEDEFQDEANRLQREDQEIYQTDVTYPEWGFDNYPWAPIDAAWMQTHEY